ncbi:MAG: GNAT family N-acetyltransferase [Provencibacterium sp.]|jgi:GNAT superfamily N-acetyltransferase|nr:GNAT family N-acetyltransferase [Provencibacterium sp.]
MQIQALTEKDALWRETAAYARGCSWRAGKELAQQMGQGAFTGWERVFAAFEGEKPAGYCTLKKRDCILDLPYTPYIGFVFVGEPFRGRRLSQRLIAAAMDYARELGFGEVYLISDHQGLYEKYGFVRVDEKPAPWNPQTFETIFMHRL